MSTTSVAIFSNPLFATYSVYARNASIILRVRAKTGNTTSWLETTSREQYTNDENYSYSNADGVLNLQNRTTSPLTCRLQISITRFPQVHCIRTKFKVFSRTFKNSLKCFQGRIPTFFRLAKQ